MKSPDKHIIRIGCEKFTLIELLVIISIIGILSAMLMPSLALAREKAITSVCKNNLKQHGLSITMYEDDNNDYFPAITHWFTQIPNGSSLPPISWDDHVAGYDGRNLSWQQMAKGKLNASDFNNNSMHYECPADDVQRKFGSNTNNLPLTYATTMGEPKWGKRFLGFTGWKTYHSVKNTMLGNPVNTIVLSENKLAGRMLGRFWGTSISAQSQLANAATIPHDGLDGSNILRGDKGVSYMRFWSTLDGGTVNNVSGTMWDAKKD